MIRTNHVRSDRIGWGHIAWGRIAALMALVVAPILGTARPAMAQVPISARTRDYLTRTQIDSQLTAAQKAGRTGEVFVLRKRLTEGDFKQGDRIVYLQRYPVPRPPDTLMVGPDKNIMLPGTQKNLSLDGVLRSELKGRIMAFLTPDFFKTADFDVTPLVRLTLQGAVLRPGPFFVRADLLVGDVIAFAIMAPNADTKKIDIRRGSGTNVLWDQVSVQTAIADGLSVDDLGLLDNDEINVATQKAPFNFTGTLSIVLSSVGLLVTLLNLTRRR